MYVHSFVLGLKFLIFNDLVREKESVHERSVRQELY